MATKPTVSWDETAPANTDSISLGDDKIRELKTQIREVVAAEHVFSSSGQGAGWGYHNQATLMQQGAAPTAVANTIILYTLEVDSKCELHVIDEDSNAIQLTSQGDFVAGMTKEVRMWSGLLANIPAGWALCDGSGSLPDLVAHFIRGVATAATDPGSTGGADSTAAVNPSHTHTHAGGDGSHLHQVKQSPNYQLDSGFSDQTSGLSPAFYSGSIGSNSYPSSDGYYHSHTTASIGSGTAFENRPAYYELAFIARG